MKRKHIKKAIYLLIILSIIAASSLAVLIMSKEKVSSTNQQASTGSNPSSSSSSVPREDPCKTVQDSYIKPDFDKVKTIIKSEDIVKDMPSSGSLQLSFYHFAGSCRKWDKNYLITQNNLEEKKSSADIEVWIHSDYASEISQGNLCDIISDANKNGHLGSSSSLSKTRLLLKYSGLLGYRDCLGL